jgi:hypothetical protein
MHLAPPSRHCRHIAEYFPSPLNFCKSNLQMIIGEFGSLTAAINAAPAVRAVALHAVVVPLGLRLRVVVGVQPAAVLARWVAVLQRVRADCTSNSTACQSATAGPHSAEVKAGHSRCDTSSALTLCVASRHGSFCFALPRALTLLQVRIAGRLVGAWRRCRRLCTHRRCSQHRQEARQHAARPHRHAACC